MKQYASKDSMRLHIKTIHEGIKSHKCQICDYATSNKTRLQGHMRHNHKFEIEKPEEDEKNSEQSYSECEAYKDMKTET